MSKELTTPSPFEIPCWTLDIQNAPTPPHPHTPTQNATVRTTWKRSLFWLPLLLCAFALTTGCEESVNPVLGTDRAYTLYGFFNPRSDTQAVRLFPVEGRLERTRPEPLDADVSSTDLQMGRKDVWQDSVVQYESGRFGHVYWSEFRAEFEHRYRLEAVRSDGATTQVEVTVPPLSEPVLLPPTVAPRFVFYPVFWPRAPRTNNIRVRYHTNCGAFTYDYGLESQEQVDGGTVVSVRVSDDARDIFQTILIDPTCSIQKLRVEEIELIVLVTNAEWIPPTGVYDPELLVEPGTFSNIENGFGFVGAGYPASIRWEPSDSALLVAGFFVGDDEDDS